MTKTLITGANKGLGFETARQLAASGHDVSVGARDPARGRQSAEAIGAKLVAIDVTDDASVAVAAAAETVGALDVLINNAGIVGERVAPAETTAAHMREIYETATDLNAHRGVQTVEDGAVVIVRYAMIGADRPTGGFFDAHGVQLW